MKTASDSPRTPSPTAHSPEQRPSTRNLRSACHQTVPRVTCVGLSVKAFFAEGSGPMVLVKVERSQRSEDERP